MGSGEWGLRSEDGGRRNRKNGNGWTGPLAGPGPGPPTEHCTALTRRRVPSPCPKIMHDNEH
jgi:hypothetical protein